MWKATARKGARGGRRWGIRRKYFGHKFGGLLGTNLVVSWARIWWSSSGHTFGGLLLGTNFGNLFQRNWLLLIENVIVIAEKRVVVSPITSTSVLRGECGGAVGGGGDSDGRSSSRERGRVDAVC